MFGPILLLSIVLFIDGFFSAPMPDGNDSSYGWLLAQKKDEITENELASKFGDFPEEENKNIAMESELEMAKPPEYAYSHALTRDKFLPMAAAAYGKDEDIQQCLGKTFENAELLRHVQIPCNGHDKQICAAFLALSHSDKAVILAFRGTSSLMQLTMETSRIIFISQTNATLGGKVAAYFAEIFDQLAEEGIIEEALQLAEAHPDYELWITGHSLGGALASLAAAEIYSSKLIGANRIKLATFGQPRTGNAEWAMAMNRAFPHYNYRIVNQRDVVVHIPIRRFQNYRHFMTEIWYKNGMDENAADFMECAQMDGNDTNCSNSLWTYSIRDHHYYFGHRVDIYGKHGCTDTIRE